MPELPEVEYTARQLRAHCIGTTIEQADVFWERTIGHPALPDFRAGIANRRIEQIRRRGKWLLFDLSGGLILTIHRRMTGNLLLLPAGWEIDSGLRESDPAAWNRQGPLFHHDSDQNSYTHELRYCRVCFSLSDGRKLLYTDPRKFGRIELWPREQESEALKGIGIEPLGEEFRVEWLKEALRGRSRGIKQVLLDQTVVAGLGNIYADEALYSARIHPLRSSESLTAQEARALHESIVSVLTQAIEHGGTSFNDYRDLWGEAGDNYNHVHVYQRDGKPCERCGQIIERIVVAQRSTHFCPGCQKLIGE